MNKVKIIPALCILLFVISCGEAVVKEKDLKVGYRFQRDSVISRNIKFPGSDSVRFTLESFTIIDTLPEFEKYIIADSVPSLPHQDYYNREYGVADFNGDIVIFPSFPWWRKLPNGYRAFKLPGPNSLWGILHVTGVVIAEPVYYQMSLDSTNQYVVCKRSEYVDTISLGEDEWRKYE